MHITIGSNLIDGPYKGDVLAFYHDFSQRPWSVSLGSDFIGFIQDDVHELIEAKDFALQSDIVVIKEPDFDSGLVLQKSENDCQRIDTFGLAFFGHFIAAILDGFGKILGFYINWISINWSLINLFGLSSIKSFNCLLICLL